MLVIICGFIIAFCLTNTTKHYCQLLVWVWTWLNCLYCQLSCLHPLSKKNTNIQEKLDFEMRMREGAYKLLLACSKREQVLNASKNLLTCNARIKAYLTQLQKMKEEQDLMGAVRRCGSGGLIV